jgi:hypothetical protein
MFAMRHMIRNGGRYGVTAPAAAAAWAWPRSLKTCSAENWPEHPHEPEQKPSLTSWNLSGARKRGGENRKMAQQLVDRRDLDL